MIVCCSSWDSDFIRNAAWGRPILFQASTAPPAPGAPSAGCPPVGAAVAGGAGVPPTRVALGLAESPWFLGPATSAGDPRPVPAARSGAVNPASLRLASSVGS